MRTPLLALSAAFATGLAAQDATESKIAVADGFVSVSFHAIPFPARTLEQHQRKGTVWSMSDKEAAILRTDRALMIGRQVIPPGEHRLSTWFKDKGDWRLLVFSGPKNFKRGTPYKSFRLQKHDYEKPPYDMLKLEVNERRKLVRIDLYAGRTRLRLTAQPLDVMQFDGEIAGEPASFEFFKYNADYRIQGRLRNLEMVHFGRATVKGAYGAVYDISCKSDGNGIFVYCYSDTLKHNRELLAGKTKALRADPKNEALAKDVAALKAAVGKQAELSRNVMVPGEVEKVKKRAGALGVKPVLGSDGTSFELSFGIRKAKFTLNPSQFRKLKWK